MRTIKRSTLAIGRWSLVQSMVLLLAACSSLDLEGTGGDEVRTIAVSMNDELRFEPDAFTVSTGETVRFEVTNEGQSAHAFLIGDEAAHADFEAAMSKGVMDPQTDAGVRLNPGDTGSFEYTFHEAGDLLAGCHEPGHYDGGMVAPISVTE